MISPQEESELLFELVGPRLNRLTAKQLAGKAYWRWNRERFLDAAVLFDVAAKRSAQEYVDNPALRNNAFCYRARAGVTFRLAGEVDRAWPILIEATTFDWVAAGIPEDSHFTEWAIVEMLFVHAEAGRKLEFSNLFWQAVKRGKELGFEFPHIHPKQESLLAMCASLELSKELAHVVRRIELQRGRSRKVIRLPAPFKTNHDGCV